ncbi:hypothetical protein FRB99_003914 [Tulasnella sp. 403]|nr:hypothetical protein FRB99_003914 [Tulasnella sp. 403]
MANFQALMKMAQENSRLSNMEAMEAAKRKEAALRQAREEQERKERAEREFQKRLMLQRSEEAKREEERKKKREEEMTKRREELLRKRDQEAELSKYAVAGSSRDGSSKGKSSNPYIVVNSTALTREEKRMAKDPLLADKLKRNKGPTAKRRRDGRLPGGAINATESGASPSKNGSSNGSVSAMTARARMAASFAPTLTRLNTEKRDMRTIDEITRDLKRGKLGGPVEKETVLSGDKAHTFGDWFTKKDKEKGKSVEAPDLPPTKKAEVNGSTSRQNSVRPSTSVASRPPLPSSSSAPKAVPKRPTVPNASSRPSASSSNPKSVNGTSAARKRSREPSTSFEGEVEEEDYDSEEEKRYAKRRADDRYSVGVGGGLGENARDLIWQIMGRDRSRYANVNVDSDDDMEATADDLLREEKMSARIAKKEDEAAEAEEKRRELEKKRRKAEKANRK